MSNPRLTKKQLEEYDISLSDEEKREIEAEVRRQIAIDLKRELKQQYMKDLMYEHKKKADPDGRTYEDLLIDLPGHAPNITLDGKTYFHGGIYKFSIHQVRTVKDIMARAWEHENEIGGANRNSYRKPTNKVLSPTGVRGF